MSRTSRSQLGIAARVRHRVAVVTNSATLSGVVTGIEAVYAPRWADEGDAVGLVVGEPDASVERVLFAIDPVSVVVQEAIDYGADLLIVHHPLLYRPVRSVAADSPKGRVITDLIRHGIALYAAHTNADSPPRGVSQSLAGALGLTRLRPIVVHASDELDKIVTFVPRADAQRVLEALASAGAGAIGDYDRCAYLGEGQGTFRPGAEARPAVGRVGQIEVVDETRLEMVLPRFRRSDVLQALRSSHPYEEPAFDVLELANCDVDRGSGRIGELEEPVTLRSFASRVADTLPVTAGGARVSGDLDQPVRRVAVLAGAGDFLLDEVRRSGADVYVTSDLRHHPASELREYDGAPALIDVPHWAAEWTWLPVAQQTLSDGWRARGWTITSEVSRLCTDPWNYRAGSGLG